MDISEVRDLIVVGESLTVEFKTQADATELVEAVVCLANADGGQVLARAFDAMGVTPEVTFYLLPGNHDPLDAASIYTSNSFRERRPANVVVLDGIEPNH